MRGRLRRSLVLPLVAGSMLTTSPASGQNLESFHRHVTAAAELLASTCPWGGSLPAETECVDTSVLYAQEGAPNEQIRRQPWFVVVLETRFLFHSEEEPVTVLYERFGFLEGASGFVDTRHLLHASVAAAVPMDDGSVYPLDLDWDMSGTDFHVSGNDGPFNAGGDPWGSHSVDQCLTQNWHAHQTWRWGGSIDGTVDGVDVNALLLPENEPFIGRGVFTVLISSHGDCA